MFDVQLTSVLHQVVRASGPSIVRHLNQDLRYGQVSIPLHHYVAMGDGVITMILVGHGVLPMMAHVLSQSPIHRIFNVLPQDLNAMLRCLGDSSIGERRKLSGFDTFIVGKAEGPGRTNLLLEAIWGLKMDAVSLFLECATVLLENETLGSEAWIRKEG